MVEVKRGPWNRAFKENPAAAIKFSTGEESTGSAVLDAWYTAMGQSPVDDFGRAAAKDLSDDELAEAIEALSSRIVGKPGMSGRVDLNVLLRERDGR